MIIGKINDDVYIDDAVLWKTKPKVVINNQEITDLETFNKVVDSIKEKDKEIERLNNIIDELINGMKYIGVLKLDKIKQYENEFKTTRIIGIEKDDKQFAVEIELKEGK